MNPEILAMMMQALQAQAQQQQAGPPPNEGQVPQPNPPAFGVGRPPIGFNPQGMPVQGQPPNPMNPRGVPFGFQDAGGQFGQGGGLPQRVQEDPLAARKAALSRIAAQRAIRQQLNPQQRPDPTASIGQFNQIRQDITNSAIQTALGMAGQNDPMGGLTPEMIMAYQNRMPLLSAEYQGQQQAHIPGMGGRTTVPQRRDRITLQDIDESEIKRAGLRLDQELAGLKARSAQESNKNRKAALDIRINQLEEHKRQFDTELGLRTRRTEVAEGGLELGERKEAREARKQDTAEKRARLKEVRERIDAIKLGRGIDGTPIANNPDVALPNLEALYDDYKDNGEPELAAIVLPHIKALEKLAAKQAAANAGKPAPVEPIIK